MKTSFLDALNQPTPLLADGATGTMLQTTGLPIGESPERWMLDNPDAIRALAAQYVAAGSDMIYTCTFGASRVHLRRCGIEDKFDTVNRTAVRLAREAAAGKDIFVVGSIGPTGEMLEPYGEFSPDEARASFAEQAALLAQAGVDAFVCETFTDLQEALLAVGAVKEKTNLPVLASMAFDANGRTMMGVTPEDAVNQLTDAGAAAVGSNCSVGPDSLEAVIRAMKVARPGARLLAKPNAGLPQVVNGRAVYNVGPDVLAAFAAKMKSLGVAVVGGCCGTTPEHLRAMRGALQ
jgi:5-methyltetrahydrofolate--homocysteine methyltransferase